MCFRFEQIDIQCSICLEEIREKHKKGFKLSILTCGHLFCQICIKKSFNCLVKCQLCRQSEYIFVKNLRKLKCILCNWRINTLHFYDLNIYVLECGHLYCFNCFNQENKTNRYNWCKKCSICKSFELVCRLYV